MARDRPGPAIVRVRVKLPAFRRVTHLCAQKRIVLVRIAVIALGKIGLPLAVQFAAKGHEVVGVDVNAEVVDLVNRAVEPFPGEAHLQEKLTELVPSGALRATTDYADAVPGADAVVLVVPLFVDDEARPDFGWLDAATEELARHLTAG